MEPMRPERGEIGERTKFIEEPEGQEIERLTWTHDWQFVGTYGILWEAPLFVHQRISRDSSEKRESHFWAFRGNTAYPQELLVIILAFGVCYWIADVALNAEHTAYIDAQ